MTVISQVKAATAAVCGVTVRELESGSTARRFSRPRQIAMYVARLETKRSLPQLALAFGGFDHTTILHAVRAVPTRPECFAKAEAVRSELRGQKTLIARTREEHEACCAVADGLKGWGGVRFDLGKTYNELRGYHVR